MKCSVDIHIVMVRVRPTMLQVAHMLIKGSRGQGHHMVGLSYSRVVVL